MPRFPFPVRPLWSVAWRAAVVPTSVVVGISYAMDRKEQSVPESPIPELESSWLRFWRKYFLGYEITQLEGHWSLECPAWSVHPKGALGMAASKKIDYDMFHSIIHRGQVSTVPWARPYLVRAVSSQEFSVLARDRLQNLKDPTVVQPEALLASLGPDMSPDLELSLRGFSRASVSQPLGSAHNVAHGSGNLAQPIDTVQRVDPIDPKKDIFNLGSVFGASEVLKQYQKPMPLSFNIRDFFRPKDEEQLDSTGKVPKQIRSLEYFRRLEPLNYIVSFPVCSADEPVDAVEPPFPAMAATRWAWMEPTQLASWKIPKSSILGLGLQDEVAKFRKALELDGIRLCGPFQLAFETQNPFLRSLGLRPARLVAPVAEIDNSKFIAASVAELRTRSHRNSISMDEELPSTLRTQPPLAHPSLNPGPWGSQ